MRLALAIVGGVVVLVPVALIVIANSSKIECRTSVFQKSELVELQFCLESWAKAHGGRYPDSIEALLELDSEGKPYLWAARRSFPADYWGHPFVYSPPAVGATPRIVSYGADGEPGGWGEDADIDSAKLKRD